MVLASTMYISLIYNVLELRLNLYHVSMTLIHQSVITVTMLVYVAMDHCVSNIIWLYNIITISVGDVNPDTLSCLPSTSCSECFDGNDGYVCTSFI